MKTIFFNPYADADVKGASRSIEFLTNILDSRGTSVEIISRDEYVNYDRSFFQKTLFRLGLRRLAYFLFVFVLTSDKNNVVISEVIFAPTWRSNFNLTVHDLKVFNKDADRGGLLRKIIYFVFIKYASRIIVVSNFTRSEVIEKCKVSPRKVFVVPNGISDSRLKTAEKYKTIDKKYDFVYVSSFAKHKRHLLLISSLPPGSRLALIGRDLGTLNSVKAEIENQGSSVQVDIFCNIDSDDQLFNMISSAYCGVFPSVFEGFGIPLLEYAACGLFVIATDIPPFRELAEYVDIFVKPDGKEDLQCALAVAIKKAHGANLLRMDAVRIGLYSEAMIEKSLLHAIGLEEK
jgi:glycosyltransferase involved in cell wall biosynthesis